MQNSLLPWWGMLLIGRQYLYGSGGMQLNNAMEVMHASVNGMQLQ